jgi:hypothetical protein
MAIGSIVKRRGPPRSNGSGGRRDGPRARPGDSPAGAAVPGYEVKAQTQLPTVTGQLQISVPAVLLPAEYLVVFCASAAGGAKVRPRVRATAARVNPAVITARTLSRIVILL